MKKEVGVIRWHGDAACDGPLTEKVECASTAIVAKYTKAARAEVTERGVRVVQDGRSVRSLHPTSLDEHSFPETNGMVERKMESDHS